MRSVLEEAPPPADDAVMSVLTETYSGSLVSAEQILAHPILSSDYSQEERLRGLNQLVETRTVVMMNMEGSVFVQAVPLDVQPRLASLSKEEGLVFDEVTKFGTNGATLKQLKRVGLRPTVLTNVIADLTRNQCITTFKPISAKRKVYLAVWYEHEWKICDHPSQFTVDLSIYISMYLTSLSFSLSVCLCLYVVGMYVYLFMYVYFFMYVCVYVCMSVWMSVCLYVCVCRYVCMNGCMSGCMYVCLCMYVFVCVHGLCLAVSMSRCVDVSIIYVDTYVYISIQYM